MGYYLRRHVHDSISTWLNNPIKRDYLWEMQLIINPGGAVKSITILELSERNIIQGINYLADKSYRET